MVTREEFESYERVRVSGVTNMFAVSTVCSLSNLTRETVLEIMDKYEELSEEYL